MSYTYLSVVETSKILRKVLKEHFPGVKFFVRSKSYAGGASIDIDWIDGPTGKQVDQVVQVYSGADFDGMNDLKTYIQHWMLPDGTIQLAHKAESYGGSSPGFDYGKPHPDAELVHLGGDYIFTHRALSLDVVKRCAEQFHNKTGRAIPEIYPGTWWVAGKEKPGYVTGNFKEDLTQVIPGGMHYQTIAREYNQALSDYTEYEMPVKDNDISQVIDSTDLGNLPTGDLTYTVTHERDWTWVEFNDKPNADIRDAMKEKLGARWSKKRKAWYIREHVDLDVVAVTIETA